MSQIKWIWEVKRAGTDKELSEILTAASAANWEIYQITFDDLSDSGIAVVVLRKAL